MLKRLTAACLLSFAGLGAAAQLPDSADMSAGGEFRRRIDRHTSTKAYRMLFVGTPLIVGGVVMQAYDSDFRRLRNGYSRSFRHDYDDWLQYAPAGAMVALKACGVRGRSSWGRMLVSDAFSAGLMAIGVNSLKYSCRVMRPDGSSRNSFPSGHTATAFMAATMLHKEYGHRSPWYSIGGYTVATITGVTRQLNNRHWMSDIMVGAGIGILATELGYFLADLIFKEKGLNVTETYSVYDRCRRPSFLGFSLGFSTVPGSYTPYPGMHMQFLSGPAVLQRAEPQFPLRHFFNRIAAVPRRTVGIGPRKHLPGRRIADKGVGPGEPGVPERPDTLVKGECPVFAELQVNRSGQGRTVLPAGQHPAVVVRLVLTAALVSAAADSQQSRGRHGKKAQSDFHTQGRPAPGFRKDGLQI